MFRRLLESILQIHEMTESNSGEGEEESAADRLSELPDSLIFEIFWRLPMREVVKTSLLSHRWKYLWTASPYLNFKDSSPNFINSALMSSWRGTRIQKLRLDFVVDHFNNSNESLYGDHIDSWLLLAKKYQVEELHVHVRYPRPHVALDELYWAPQCLYSCSSLRTLVLKGFSLHIPNNNVNWNQLEALDIHVHNCVSADLINQDLFGSPNLLRLILYFMENRENLRIRTNSLKYLFIYKFLCHIGDDPCMDTELRISTPNLEFLKLEGVPYSKCLIDNAPSLARANLVFDGLVDPTSKSYYYKHLLFSGNDFVEETLKQILPAIQHVGQVGFSDWCIEV